MILKQRSVMKAIAEAAQKDNKALALLRTARECAEVHELVTKRQKGCDGLGELAMIKEEFREALDDLVCYCKGKKYLPEGFMYELETAELDLSDFR